MGWQQGHRTGRLWLPSGCILTCPLCLCFSPPLSLFPHLVYDLISQAPIQGRTPTAPPPGPNLRGDRFPHIRFYHSSLRTPAGHHQVIPSSVWCWGIGYPHLGSSEGDVRLSDLSSRESPRTVQVEDNKAPPHLGRYNFPGRYKTKTVLPRGNTAGHQSSGSLYVEGKMLKLLAGVVG